MHDIQCFRVAFDEMYESAAIVEIIDSGIHAVEPELDTAFSALPGE
jgi:hypothetical protein